MTLLQISIATVLIEYVIQILKTVIKDGKLSVWVLVAIGIGEVFAFGFKLDLTVLVQLSSEASILGYIVTGLIISAGTDLVHALLNKIKTFNTTTTTETETTDQTTNG